MTVKRILCVEDEQDLLETLCDYLESQGYKAIPARNGREALDLVALSRPFDLILCDIAMPEMDGLSFLKCLRADRRYDTAPFIFMTALGQKHDVIKAHRFGCDDYLVKPVDFDVLDALMASRLARSEVIDSYYVEPQQAFQTLMLQALSEEMMEPTNAIVSTTCTLMQMLEGKDALMERRFAQIFQSASQQLTMLQQLALMLQGRPESHAKLADYPCLSADLCSHIERLMEAYHLADRLCMASVDAVRVLCDPFLISKALAALLVREVVAQKEKTMQISLNCSEADGRVSMLLLDAAADLHQCRVQLVRGYADCALHHNALRGKIISVLFLQDVARLHDAELELLYQGEAVAGYRIRFPMARSVYARKAV